MNETARGSQRALLGLLAAITASGPVTLNIYLPIVPAAQAELHASLAAASTTVSAALAAFAIGVLVSGPLSDRVGRRPVVLVGLLVFLAGSLISMTAQSIGALTLGRVVQAVGTSAGITVARAIVGDLYAREYMARAMAYLTMIMGMANALAPSLGGALGEYIGWRAVFLALLLAGTGVTVWAYRALPETRTARAAATGPGMWHSAADLLGKGRFLGLALQCTVVYATFLVFVSFMPYVFRNALHRSAAEYGLWYLCIAVGYFGGNFTVARLATRLGLPQLLRTGVALQALAAFIAVALAMVHAWHPACIFVPWALLAYGQGLALPSATAEAVALAPHRAGAASGLLGFSQQMTGAVSVQLMSLVAMSSPVPVTVFVAACAAIAWVVVRLWPPVEPTRAVQ